MFLVMGELGIYVYLTVTLIVDTFEEYNEVSFVLAFRVSKTTILYKGMVLI